MGHPLVTIITPAYNVDEYLAEAVESVLAQTERDFEYLIVDDGSTDRTREIAEHFAALDPRVRVLNGGHHGSSAARNVGLRSARGAFIAFCDGDDRWSPAFLATSLAVLRAAPAEVGATFAAASHIDQFGNPLKAASPQRTDDYDAEQVLALHCPQGNGSCLLIRTSCFDEAGLFDEDLFNCVDLEMWLRIGTKSSAPLFRSISQPLVEWRVRPGAISSSELARVEGLAVVLDRYAHVLTPASTARAYTWPALLAYFTGRDDLGSRWSEHVRCTDERYWLRSRHGLALAVFRTVGPRRGRVLRSALGRLRRQVRSLVHPRVSGH